MIIVLYVVTALLYGGLSFAAWRAYRRQPALDAVMAAGTSPSFQSTPTAAPQPLRPPPQAAARAGVSLPAARVVLFAALVAHGFLLHATVFPADSMVFGFAFSLSAMLWLGAGIYLIESFFFPLEGLGLLVLPLACLGALMPLIFGGVRVLSYAADPLFKIHFLIANVAYGLLTIAALHAVLMLAIERRLHAARGSLMRPAARQGLALKTGNGYMGGQETTVQGGNSWLSGWLETLPPLLTLEKLLFRLISAGFLMLTLTLVSGILFSEQLLDRLVSFDHKTVFAVVSWVLFGVLVAGRTFYGWRGRTALRWVLLAFVSLLLAYVGSRFVLEVLLHRQVV